MFRLINYNNPTHTHTHTRIGSKISHQTKINFLHLSHTHTHSHTHEKVCWWAQVYLKYISISLWYPPLVDVMTVTILVFHHCQRKKSIVFRLQTQ